jgi:pyruvate dehydrogenase (quinone)
VISLPGDVAAADAPSGPLRVTLPATTEGPASAGELAAMAALGNEAQTGGDLRR